MRSDPPQLPKHPDVSFLGAHRFSPREENLDQLGEKSRSDFRGISVAPFFSVANPLQNRCKSVAWQSQRGD
jgi:hypothetical protein